MVKRDSNVVKTAKIACTGELFLFFAAGNIKHGFFQDKILLQKISIHCRLINYIFVYGNYVDCI